MGGGNKSAMANDQAQAQAAAAPINHVTALTPPSMIDPAIQNAARAALVASAQAAGRASTVATSPQGDMTAALTSKKTLLGG